MRGKNSIIIYIVTFVFLSFFSLGAWSVAAEFEGEIEPGLKITDYNGHPGKVGEYDVLNQGCEPKVDFSLKGSGENFNFDASGSYSDYDEQEYSFDADINRILQEEFTYKRFQHWLDHDSLENLAAVKGAGYGPVVYHDDLEVGSDYIMYYGEEKSKTTLNLPFLPGAQMNFDYRRQVKRGERQSLAMSHCAACHVVSRGRRINEETTDYKFGASIKRKWFSLLYSFTDRDFHEHGSAPVNYYDEIMHPNPAKPAGIFDDRAIYGNANLPYNHVPDSEKYIHTIKAKSNVIKNSVLYGSYTRSNIENNSNNSEVDFDSWFARFSNYLIPGLVCNFKFRYYEIDNDDIFVDIPEFVANAGPNAGLTYQDVYGFDPDFLRESAMSRDVTTFNFDTRYRLTPKTSLKAGYEWEKIDRDDFIVGGGGEKETKKNTVKFDLNSKLHRKLKARLSYKYEKVNDPFSNYGAACEPANPTPTPGDAFGGTQYYARQDSRTAKLSNQPTEKNDLKLSLNWTLKPNLRIFGSYHYIDSDNDETDFVEWEQESHMPSLNIWYAPTSKISLNLSYVYNYMETDSLACIPVFDG